MDISKLSNDLEKISSAYAKRYNIKQTPEWYLLKLTEELGELTQSYLKYMGQARTNGTEQGQLRRELEDELADVLGMTLLVAKNQNIDIKKAIMRKWLRYLKQPESTQ